MDAWSRVWIVDSHNSRVQVTDNTGTVLGAWTFPNVTLYGIAISEVRASSNNAMVYLTGNSGSGSATSTIMLLQAVYDPMDSSKIGSNIPLTAWNNQPGTLLHWISCGTIAQDDTMLVNELSGTFPGALAYQLAIPRPLFQVESTPSQPLWPTSFHAVALFHPFEKNNQVLTVAEIWYTESSSMRFDIYTLSGIELSLKYQLVGGQTQYQFAINGSAYSPPQPTNRVIPAHDWIAKVVKYQGQLPLLGEQTDWWYEIAPTKNNIWVT